MRRALTTGLLTAGLVVLATGPDASTSSALAASSSQRSVQTGEPIVLSGRGNGHGIGLSQYGAHGQALAGRSADDIIRHYYSGASVRSASVGFDPRIGVLLDQTRVRLVVRGGAATMRIGGQDVSAASGTAWQVRILSTGAQCHVTGPGGEVYKHTASSGVCIEADPRSGARIDVQRWRGGTTWSRHNQYGRAAVVEVIKDAVRGSWKLDAVVELPLEQYLYGLAEMPYSWPEHALRSQAVAGRSYALWRLQDVGSAPDRGCRCHLYDSQQDQVYDGWERERSPSWARWKGAVDATAGRVVAAPGAIGTRDGVVQAFYSSSSNGRTEAKHELWGGSVYPYLVSVDDPWTFDRRTGNPHRSWTVALARGKVASKVGLDRLASVQVTARTTSGSSKEVRFTGTTDGRSRSVARSGSWMRTTFGLRSTTFEVTGGNSFGDIASSRHAADIWWLVAQGITSGCSSDGSRYCPKDPVNRGQMAAFLKRAFELPPGSKVFADTRTNRFRGDIAALHRAGITSGCSRAKDLYCPGRAVTRAEMAAFLARAKPLPPAGPTSMIDARDHRHSHAIEAVRRAGVTRGCNSAGTKFCPDDPVTREQMASFLRRILEL